MVASRLVPLLVSPNFGEDQMQFLCLNPEHSSLRFQFRHRPNNHPKKMLGFARFLPASSDAFQKVLFGNCVVGFDVVSAYTRAGSNQLTDNSISYRILWNPLRKIDNCFAKSGGSFFQIVNAFCLLFFADKSCPIIPKRIVGARVLDFRFRHFFVIRHSSFVISIRWCCAIPCTTKPSQIPSHASLLYAKFSALLPSRHNSVRQNISARRLELFSS